MNIAYCGKFKYEYFRAITDAGHEVRLVDTNVPEIPSIQDRADLAIFLADADAIAAWASGFANTPSLKFLRGYADRPLIIILDMDGSELYHQATWNIVDRVYKGVIWANYYINQYGTGTWKPRAPTPQELLSHVAFSPWARGNLKLNFFVPTNLPSYSHPGSFAAVRRHDTHTGVDLYGSPGDIVYSFTPGVVESIHDFTGPDALGVDGKPLSWWLPTKAVTVRLGSQYFVYGEIVPNPYLKVGSRVFPKTEIGTLTPVLPPHKLRSDIPHHSTTMLHFEWWEGAWDQKWDTWRHGAARPKGLKDPTNRLIALSRGSDQGSGVND